MDSGIDITHEAFAHKLWKSAHGQIGYNVCSSQQTMNDTYGHGTQVASVITAVNPHTPLEILPVKVLCNNASGTHAEIIAGLDYVLGLKQQGVDITAINMSWGGQHRSRILESALRTVADADVLLVASAGNSGNNIDQHTHYPASYDIDGMLVVASSNHQDYLSSDSNYGLHSVDLLAPGEKVLAAAPNNDYQYVS